jgi:ComF family protein
VCAAETLTLDLPGACRRCGEPFHESRCGCGDLPAVIDIARSAAVYDGWVSAAVQRLKYDREPDRARHLASFLLPLLPAFGLVDALVPVPLHPSKERDRGFNQSALLGMHLSEMSGIPIHAVLQRTRKTVSQTTLSGRQRRENVANVFAIDPTWQPRPGLRYVLVDDVRTTGATLGACASALQGHGASRVGVLTFALDMRKDELESYRETVRTHRASARSMP